MSRVQGVRGQGGWGGAPSPAPRPRANLGSLAWELSELPQEPRGRGARGWGLLSELH